MRSAGDGDRNVDPLGLLGVFEQCKAWRLVPHAIRCDKGPEFIALTLPDWCQAHATQLRYTHSGKPNQNAYIEHFNRKYRNEVLDAQFSGDPQQVREITANWKVKYMEKRPHESLGNLSPGN